MTRQTNLYVSILIFLTLAAAATIYPRYEWQVWTYTVEHREERAHRWDYTNRECMFGHEHQGYSNTQHTRSLIVENLLLEYVLAFVIASLSYVAPPVVALLKQRKKTSKQ